MPLPSRGIVNGQRVKLKSLQDTADKQIRVAFATAHMAMSPQVDAFTRAYSAELQKARHAVPAGEQDADEEDNNPNATVPLTWLFTSGELKRLTDVIQKAVEAAAKESAKAASAGQDDAADAGVEAASTLVRQAQPKGQQQNTQVNVPAGTAAALLAQAQALDPENTDTVGVDETIDGIPNQTVKDTRNSIVTGLVAGLGSQAMQQAAFMAVQGALTAALTASRNGIQDAFNQTVNLTITKNADILSGWIWQCTYQNSCIACIEMDGSIHGWDEDLNSHLNCYCMQVPYSGPLPDDFMTGDQWFNQQSDLVQQEILGPSKYLAWKSGDVQLMDFIDHSNGYVSERSLKSLGLDARDYLQTLPTAQEMRDMQAALEDATADLHVVAYAAELPGLPEIKAEGLQPNGMQSFSPNVGSEQELRTLAEQKDMFGTTTNQYFDWEPVIEKMGAQLADNQDVLDLAAKVKIYDFGTNTMVPGKTSEDAVRAVLGGYHTSFTYKADPFSVAIQEAAASEFGVSSRAYVVDAELMAAADKQYGDVMAGIRAVERQMYDNTQAFFQERGITEVDMFRGLRMLDKEESIPGLDLSTDRPQALEVRSQPLSSFSINPWNAATYTDSAQGEGYGLVIGAKVPVERIISIPQTGFGAYGDFEAIVLGGTDDFTAVAKTYEDMTGDILFSKDELFAKLGSASTTLEEKVAQEVSPEVKALQDQRAALQTQRDAAQAKLDTLSEKWRAAVLDAAKYDPEEDPAEYAAAEKKIASIEKQQATQLKKMDTLDAKMAKQDAKIAAQQAKEAKATAKITQVAGPELPKISPTAAIPAEGATPSELTQLLGSTVQPSEDMSAALAENAAANAASAQDLLTRLSDNTDFQAFMAKQARGDPQGYTEMMLHAWNTGYNNPMYEAIQMAVSDEFNLNVDLRGATYYAREELYLPNEAAFRAFVRAQYDATQQWFQEQGITEIELYRGVQVPLSKTDAWISNVDWGTPGTADTAPIPGTGTIERSLLSPASAFSTDADKARYFAQLWGNVDQRSIVLGAKVPVERVLSTSATGFGSKAEAEVVVLGSKAGNTFAYEAQQIKTGLEGGAAVAEAVEVGGVGAPTGLSYVLPEIDQAAEDQVVQAAQDALSGDGVVSHTDAIALGQQIDDYIDQRAGPLAEWHQEASSLRAMSAKKDYSQLTADMRAWIQGDTSAHGGLTIQEVEQQYAAVRQSETLRLLEQARDVGGVDLSIASGGDQAVADALQQVQDVFPSDWLTLSNEQGDLLAGSGAASREGLGYYAAQPNGLGRIGLRVTEGMTDEEKQFIAIHELGHRMEDAVPGLWQMERDFYEARTVGEEYVALTNGIKAMTKLDEWTNQYFGRKPIPMSFPGANGVLRRWESYELLSNGLQYVLSDNPIGYYYLQQDQEFWHWVLGILFGAKGTPPA